MFHPNLYAFMYAEQLPPLEVNVRFFFFFSKNKTTKCIRERFIESMTSTLNIYE